MRPDSFEPYGHAWGRPHVVPEPSDYGVLFMAVALALVIIVAVYRRQGRS